MATQHKRVEMELPCLLTDEETHSRCMMLVETVTATAETNAARAASMKEFKDKITGLAERQRELSNVLNTGIESRMVACIAQFHTPAESTKRIIRTDTGEVVREESMTAAECQVNLFESAAEFESYMRSQVDPEPPPEDREIPPQ